MKKTTCTYCKKEMDCPKKMLAAKVHICDDCMKSFGEKDNPNLIKFLKGIEKEIGNVGKKFDKCDKIAKEITKMEFNIFLENNNLKETKELRKAFAEGSFSTLTFITIGGMDEEFLDSLLEATKEVRLHKQNK